MEQLNYLAVVVVGLAAFFWPERMMGLFVCFWALIVGKQTAENVAHIVFTPPHFVFPRAIGVIFVLLGLWLLLPSPIPANI